MIHYDGQRDSTEIFAMLERRKEIKNQSRDDVVEALYRSRRRKLLISFVSKEISRGRLLAERESESEEKKTKCCGEQLVIRAGRLADRIE